MTSPHSLVALVSLTLVLGLNSSARSQEILVLDWNSVNTTSQIALDTLSLPYTLTTDGTAFSAALDAPPAGGWDLVGVDNPPNNMDTFRLASFIDAGGSAVVAYWNLDTALDLQASFDLTSAVDFTAPQEFVDSTGGLHCVWDGPSGTLTGVSPDPAACRRLARQR